MLRSIDIADEMVALVRSGELPTGSRFASHRRLAEEFGASRTTIAAALDELERRGWAEQHRNARATVTMPAPSQEPLATVDDPAVRDFSAAVVSAPLGVLDDAFERARARLVRHGSLSGYQRGGLPELRERIAARYAAQGLPTAVDQIVVTPGAMAAVDLVAGTPPRTWLVQHPTYPDALRLLRYRRHRLASWSVRRPADITDLAAVLRDRRVDHAYLGVDFQNPTGAHLDLDERAAVAALLDRAGVVTVIDETMRDLVIDRAPRVPSFASCSPHAICVGSLAKTVWGGLRVGWLRAASGTAAQLRAAPSSATSVPLLEQLVACELLDRLDDLVAIRVRRLRQNRATLVKALRTAGYEIHPPAGGLVLWFDTGTSTTALARALRAEGVGIEPGRSFFADGTGDNWLRLPLTRPASECAPVLAALGIIRSG